MEKIEHYEFGIVGLGVMGRNLLLNMADHGFAVAGFDLDQQKVSLLKSEISSAHLVQGTTQVVQFVNLLRKPRAIMLLVPAGKHVHSLYRKRNNQNKIWKIQCYQIKTIVAERKHF